MNFLLLCLQVFFAVAASVEAKICSLSEPMEINNGLTMQHYVNVLEDTITMRLAFEGWKSWLGVGVSESGLMSPATAVIGRILDGAPNVQEYNMTSNNKDASGVVPLKEEDSSLVSSNFTQTDDLSTLEFTKPFDSTTTFIYAVGLKNQWEGKHKLHGSFSLDQVHECQERTIIEEDEDETDDPILDLKCNLSAPIKIAQDLTLEQRRFKDTYTMRLKYTGGQTWIGIGLKDKSSKKPPVAVIGRAYSDGNTFVSKYILNSFQEDGSGIFSMAPSSQTLMNASFVQTNTSSTLTFTKYLEESMDVPAQVVTDDSVWVYAVGLPDNQWTGIHKLHGALKFDLSSCDETTWTVSDPPEEQASDTGSTQGETNTTSTVQSPSFDKTTSFWLIHGGLLMLSWVILCPVGICVSLLRKSLPSYWHKIHVYCHAAAMLFTAVAILVAVLATKKEGRTSMQTSHSYFGIIVLILLVILAFASFGNPDLTQNQNKERPPLFSISQFNRVVRLRVTMNGIETIDLEEASPEALSREKPVAASAGVTLHRLIGLLILLLAWLSIYTGCNTEHPSWKDRWDKNYTYITLGVVLLICSITLVFTTLGSMEVQEKENMKSGNVKSGTKTLPPSPPRDEIPSSPPTAPIDPPGKFIYFTLSSKEPAPS